MMKLSMRNMALASFTAAALATSPDALAGTCELVAKTNGDQTVQVGATVSLNASPSQHASSYAWSQNANDPVRVALEQAHNDGQVKFVVPDVGSQGATFHFTVVVSGCSTTATSSVTVTVPATNRPPVASFSAPDTVNEGETITLDGGASSDPDGDTLQYAWFVNGGSQPFATTPVATFTAPPAPYPNGLSLTFHLTVSDGTLTASADKIVTVKHLNDTPVASATCTPATVDEGGEVTLDATGSSDLDDGIATYSWSQVLGGPDSNLTSDQLSQAKFSFAAPKLTFGHSDTMTFGVIVTDRGGLKGTAQCQVQVVDKTPPNVTVHPPVPAEATSAAGAAVSFTASAVDDYDGPVDVTCTSASGATFKLGDTAVTCTATDKAGNAGSASFTVIVRDTTPPALSPASNVTAEATGPSGAAVSFTPPTAFDLVDGVVPVSCTQSSGATFPLGDTTVTCTAADSHDNHASNTFTVTVQDTTPPTLTLPASTEVEATGPAGATFSYSASATDLVDGSVAVTCTPSTFDFDFGDTTVSCSATDTHGNTANGSFVVSVVDTTPPTVTPPADVTSGPTSLTGANVPYGSAWATDLVDGSGMYVDCEPTSNSLFPFGTTQVTCSSTDQHGNTGTAKFNVTVTPFTFLGFFQPVDPKALNSVKAGATVPLKWKLQGQGGLEFTDTKTVQSITATNVNCSTTEATNDTQLDMATGGTSLRYDFTAAQFVFNWATPKSPGTCWRIAIAFTDGAPAHVANFKLK